MSKGADIKNSLSKYLRIARFDHWLKNVFVIPGLVFAAFLSQTRLDAVISLHIALGILATCFTASANYVVNEWLDAEFDRFHPVKKNRAVVSGGMSVRWVCVEYGFFAITGMSIAV